MENKAKVNGKPTSAKNWASNNHETVTLPSGNVAILRRPNIFKMLTQDGDVPDSLYSVIMGAKDNSGSIAKSNLPEVVAFYEKVVKEAFVSPRVADSADYDNEVISTEDLSFADMVHVVSWAMGSEVDESEVARFRKEQPASVDGPSDRKRIRE